MGKNSENIPYDWADDYLWSEYDGDLTKISH